MKHLNLAILALYTIVYITPILYGEYPPITTDTMDAGSIDQFNRSIGELYSAKLSIRPQNVVPLTSSFYSLGTSNYYWESLYVNQIFGTQTNNEADAGFVGEYISSGSATTQTYTTSAQWKDFFAISLTAGDWDVTGKFLTIPNASNVTDCAIAISSTAGNDASGQLNGINSYTTISVTTTGNSIMIISNYRVSLASSVTYYLKGLASYSAGTPAIAGGILSARRVR